MLALLALCGFVYERWSRSHALEVFPPVGQMFDAGQSRLHIHCLGDPASSPAVLFEVGWGGSSLLWQSIMESLAGDARVCAYDRRGMVWSEFRSYTDYPRQAARDLALLLEAAGINQPLIIAAHSLGGAYARVFAGEYPDRVAVLLLIDSVHHDMLQRLDPIDPASLPFEVRFPGVTRWLGEIGIVRLVVEMELGAAVQRNPGLETMLRTQAAYAPNHLRGKAFEFNAAPMLHKQSASYPALADTPVIVLSRGQEPDSQNEDVARNSAIWQDMQRDLLNISSDSRQVVATESGHNIPVDQPQLVVDLIREMLDEARRASR